MADHCAKVWVHLLHLRMQPTDCTYLLTAKLVMPERYNLDSDISKLCIAVIQRVCQRVCIHLQSNLYRVDTKL